MTDGGDSYPSSGILKIKQLISTYQSKIYYFSIFFGSGYPSVLDQITNELKGKSFQTENFDQLMHAYSQCIEIMIRVNDHK
jgi:hypothetical protein